MAIELTELDQVLTWIKDCDRALQGGDPPDWLQRKMRDAQRRVVLEQRAHLVNHLRLHGVPIVDEHV